MQPITKLIMALNIWPFVVPSLLVILTALRQL